MQITLATGQTITAKSVTGGGATHQGARRDYLEFVFDRGEATVEELNALFAAGSADITLTDDESGESYIHSGYVVRGPIRVYPTDDDAWEVSVRQYQRTQMEAMVADMAARLAALEGGHAEV